MKDRMDLRGFIFHDIDPVGAPEKKEIAKILDFLSQSIALVNWNSKNSFVMEILA